MELRIEERAVFSLRRLFRSYGYRMYRMSRFEEYDLYVRNKDFLTSDQIVTFGDRNGKLLALKPDVTLSIMKYAPQEPGAVQKVYYDENVYRTDPNTHTLREIMQTGLECVGDLGEYEIAEVLLLAVKSLALLEMPYMLDISHMGLVGAMLEGLEQDAKKQIMELLRQKNAHDMAALCSGLGLSEALTQKLLYLVTCRGKTQEVLAGVEALLQTQQEREAFAELKNLCTYLEQSGYADNVRVDFSVGSDMKYYSGVVFKGYLEGVFGTILSGGQYDRLLQRMGRKGSAVGFAVYVDLLRAKNESNDDVDTLILTDPDVPTAVILAAAEAAGKDGTVLVCREKPQGRSWRQIVDLRKERNQ